MFGAITGTLASRGNVPAYQSALGAITAIPVVIRSADVNNGGVVYTIAAGTDIDMIPVVINS